MWRVLLKYMAKILRCRCGRWKVVDMMKILAEEGFVRVVRDFLWSGE
jgi:hypothetical protein